MFRLTQKTPGLIKGAGDSYQVSGVKNLTSDPESFFCILCTANM
jgi:hypothetical protein